MKFTENKLPYMREDSRFVAPIPADVEYRLVAITTQWVEFVSSNEKIYVHPDKAIELLNNHIQTGRSMTFG